ncbi:HpcH/HpaI aldolase family protein [Algibacter mikhailovii]|uniref:4-hydroxy-2-oxo-heptane-1,7-dioate aldolase n=1 Tax=Algibacter mikhailovii TaxID=425498 RepID=A0A918R5N2_9FLAO|nr:aldolase/citrate lyase family protein [Algibacter mikhailovii]GGZ87578.1 4-hydroxy-2-oxo-heptane-1,7-dioate aldolase [Algibacter mikhailovii]
MSENKLKKSLNERLTVFGPFCKIQDPTIVEIVALSRFDFVIIDMEHGPYSIETTQNMVRAAEAKGITPIVRVTENSETLILRVLDIGVKCIQVPQICTNNDAEKVVKATKFFPIGERGMCRYVRAAEYTNIKPEDHFGKANDSIISIIHIEGQEGLKNLPEILLVEGIDVIFLGPYDLSQSCGVPGQINHPKVVDSIKQAVELAKRQGKVIGTFTESPETAKMWQSIGVQYISYAVDVGLIMNSFKNITNQLKTN